MASRATTTVIGLSMCSLLVLSACAGNSSGSGGGTTSGGGGSSSAPGGTITIANVTDFSGTQSVLGIDENAGLQLAVDQINAAGGIKSLGGAQLAVKKYDTESNPDNGVTQANKAVSDGAKVVVGGEISDTVIAATNVTHRAGIPWITPGGTAIQVTNRGFNDVFQAVANTDQGAQSYFDVMKFVAGKLNLSSPTMGLSYSDTTYGNNLHDGFAKANSAKFFNTVADISYPLSAASDLSSVAARMIADSPQVLFNEGYPTDGLNLGQLFSSKLTTTAKIMLTTATPEVVLKQLAAKGNGMLLTSGPSASFKGMPAEFTTVDAAFKAKNGKDLTNQAVVGYEAGMFIGQALEKAASTKGSDIASALHSVELTHATGNLNAQDTLAFGPTGALKEAPFYYVQMQDAKLVGVYPEAIAAAAPIPFR
jgi:branched-chain amino acid transport system substrate-binding protein